MTVESQSPEPRIYIYDSSMSLKLYLTSDSKSNLCLLSYSYTESVESLIGQFSFSVPCCSWKENQTTVTPADKISALDIVYLYEGNTSFPTFIGIIRKMNYAAGMNGSGVSKKLVFSGDSAASLFERFSISMDIKLNNVTDANTASTQFTEALAKENDKVSIKEFIKKTWADYNNTKFNGHAVSSQTIASIVKRLFSEDFVDITKDIYFKYDIACSLYTQGVNKISGIWKNMLPPPLYEIYGIVKDGNPKIHVGIAPFSSDDWSGLKSFDVPTSRLTAYDFSISDAEVYTAYFSYLEGSVLSSDVYATEAQCMSSGESTLKIDDDKIDIYGYNPLILTFVGFDQNKAEKPKVINDIKQQFRQTNIDLYNWYKDLDKMAEGTISIVTDYSSEQKNPVIGEKCSFLGAEFYIKALDHAWEYGGSPQITMQVSRGGIYNNGEFVKKIPNIGLTDKEIGAGI